MNPAADTADIRVLKRFQRQTLLLLVVGGVINYFDRSALAIANPLIRAELGLSVAQMGLLLSAFTWAYALGQLPSGALVDRYGPRRILGGGMLFWSLAQIGSAFAGTLGQFMLGRALLGLGESTGGPSAQRVTADWFHPRVCGSVTGIWNATASLGPAIAPLILTALMLAFGWRWMFIVVGAAGVVLAIVWYAMYRDRGERRLSDAEQQHLGLDQQAPATRAIDFATWRRLFAFRSTWGLMLGYFGLVYMAWLWQAWLPGYLEIQHHMSIARTGVMASIPFAFGVVGSLGGGWVSDRLARSTLSVVATRKLPLVIGMLGTAACTALVTQVTGDTLAIVFISGAMFFTGASSAAAWTLAGFVAPRGCYASMTSLQTFGGFIGGGLAPTITGFIVHATGSFDAALLLSAAIGVATSVAYLALVRNRPIAMEVDAAQS